MAIPELRLKSLEDCKGITTFGRWKEVCPVAPQEPHGDRWEIVVIQWWEIVFFGLKWINMDQSGLTKIMVGNWLFSGFQ